MTGRWLEPRCCTVIGAAHRRRGQPCQDASLAIRLAAPDGSELQLIAVADGHGNRRHWLSGEGSALACQAAERAVRQALATTPLRAKERWRELLLQGLPEAIVQDWLAATAADWASRPEAAEQPFSPLPYGSTLGLVLLAPGWWGCTGLGDWDLVRVAADGGAQLISEEASDGLGGAAPAGEATASLCLPGAAALFAERGHLELLPAEASGVTGGESGQALVLSSDGMRKSCLTDADFLQLCGQLSAVADPAELEAGLAQITAEGSGDDVSVAMAVWAAAKPRRTGRSRDPEALQTSARKPAALQNSSHQGTEQPLIPAPPISEPKPWPLRWQALALLLALGGGLAAVGGWWWWTRQPLTATHAPATSATPQAVPAAVAREIARQCAAPDRIRANLNQRRTQFEQLIQTHETSGGPARAAERPARQVKAAGPAVGGGSPQVPATGRTATSNADKTASSDTGKAAASATGAATTSPAGRIDAEHDPLGALIAASRNGRLPGCTRLEQELRLQWQRAAGLPAGAGQPGRMPAENGRPAATPATPTREP